MSLGEDNLEIVCADVANASRFIAQTIDGLGPNVLVRIVASYINEASSRFNDGESKSHRELSDGDLLLAISASCQLLLSRNIKASGRVS